MISLKKILDIKKLAEGSVGYHTTIAQTAKNLSTKHKHTALAMKSKFKFKPPALGNNLVVPAREGVEQVSEVTAEKAMKQHHKWLKTLEGQTSDSIASKLAKAKESEANHQAEINAKLKSGEMKQGGFEHKSMVSKWNRLSRNTRDLETKHSWLKAKEAKNKN